MDNLSESPGLYSVVTALKQLGSRQIEVVDATTKLHHLKSLDSITDDEARKVRSLLRQFRKEPTIVDSDIRSNLALYSTDLAHELESRKKYHAARIVLEGAISLREIKSSSYEWALCQFHLGRLLIILKYSESALEAFNKAEDVFDQQELEFELAACWKFQGRILFARDRRSALAKFQSAAVAFEKQGDEISFAKCLNHIGTCLLSLNAQLDMAKDGLEAALKIFLEYRDEPRSKSAFDKLIRCYTELGYKKYPEQSKIVNQISDSKNASVATLPSERARASDFLANLKFKYAYSLYKTVEHEYQKVGRTTESMSAGRFAAIANIHLGKSGESITQLDNLLENLPETENNIDIRSRIQCSQALAFNKQGQIYSALGAYRAAENTIGHPDPNTTFGAIYENMATLLRQQGHYTEALTLLKGSAEIDHPVLDSVKKSHIFHQLGKTLTKLPNPTIESIHYLNKAKEGFDQACMPRSSGQCSLDLGEAYFNLDRWDEASKAFTDAKDIGYETGLQRIQATSLRYLASIDERRGQHSLAGIFRNRANAIYEQIDREGSLRVNADDLELNRLWRMSNQADNPEFISPFQSITWDHQDDSYAIDDLRARIKFELRKGIWLTDKQGDHAASEDHLRTAREILAKINSTHGDLWTQVNSYLIIALARSNKLTESAKIIESAFSAIDYESYYQRWIRLYAQGLYEYHTSSDDSVQTFSGALDALEDFRNSQLIPELRLTFFREYSEIFEELVKIATDLNNLGFTFKVIQIAKGRTFLDLLETHQGDHEAFGHQSLGDELKNRRTSLKNAWDERLPIGNKQKELTQKLHSDIERNEFAYLKDLEAYYFNRSKTVDRREISLEDIQASINQGQAILDFFCLPGSLVLFWTFKDRLELTFVDYPKQTISSVAASINDWDKLNLHPATHFEQVIRLKKLAIIGPWQRMGKSLGVHIRDILKASGISDLFIVPHQELASIPIHFLELPADPIATLLGEHADISYIPSASSYPILKESSTENTSDSLTMFADSDGSLAFAKKEAEFAGSFLEKSKVNIFVGQQVTEKSFWSNWNKSEILHLSVHGMARRHSYTSFLKLHDNLIFLNQIMETSPALEKTNLVILNACESGVRDGRAPNESMGIMTAFLIAGSASVISTLWKVNDLSGFLVTQQLLTSLLVTHERPSIALRNAISYVRNATKKDILDNSPIPTTALNGFNDDDRPFAHPYFWSTYTLMGKT